MRVVRRVEAGDMSYDFFKTKDGSKEKKPPYFGMLCYYAKVMKVTKVLNKTLDMTANFIKTKAKKESKLESELEGKKPSDLCLLDYKAEIGEGNTEKLKSELESEVGEKKLPDFGMLSYNAMVMKVT